jgi:uncharacterized protein YfiM (DUF2279 family)
LNYRNKIFCIVLAVLLIRGASPCHAEENSRTGGTGAFQKSPDAWLARDKAQHFIVSFLMTGAAGYAARTRWNWNRPESVKWSVGLTLSLGVMKELRDRRHPGSRASLKDLTADVLGIASGVLLLSWW